MLDDGVDTGAVLVQADVRYQAAIAEFRRSYQEECVRSGVDYVPVDTSVQFDKALMEYLLSRRARG